jgi:hypothetical protein
VKKALLITIIIVLVIGTGFYLYHSFYSKKPLTLWELVPTNTVLVYEPSDCKSCLQELKNSPVVKIIREASIKQHADSSNSLYDLVLGFQDPTLISLHITKKDEFDFAYYVLNSPTFQQKIDMLSQELLKKKGVKATQRQLNEVLINEISLGGKIFSSALIENVWVGSYSPIVIEDIIRTYKAEKKNSFKDVINSVYQLPRIKNDGGNLYVHLYNLSQWFALFTRESSSFLIDHFGHSSLLDIKISENKLVLNGFSYHPPQNQEYFLSAFAEQTPVEFRLKSLVSSRTLLLNDFGISNGKTFFNRLSQLTKNPYSDTIKIVQKSLKASIENLLTNFKGEIAIGHLESRKDALTRVLLINDEVNADKWLTMFKEASTAFATDTVFVDAYSEYEIYEMPLFRFPEKLFYPLVTGFDVSYYARVGNTLCIGENIEELKKFLDDIDQENTWGKSVAQNRYFESTLLESSVSIFINTPKVWNLLDQNLQPGWQTFISQHKNLFSSLGMAAIQFSHLNDTYYTNVSWSFKEPKEEDEPKSSDQYITNFQSGIARFDVAQNHVDGSEEILVQDSSKTVSLLSDEGKILWQLPLSDFIAGEVHQVDFFNNGKLQFFFATPGTLHIIDRLGNYVKPFPVAIKEHDIEHVSIIDYDHSKKYRFLLASKEGRLWMFDKEGNNLEGWQPRAVDEQLTTPVRHHRILGKDYLVAVRKDGFVYLMNRRGELLKNFPLDLNTRLQGDYFLEIGKKASNTFFTVISSDGVKYKFNLQGKIESKDAFVKNAADAKFTLITEKKFKSYVVLRSEGKMFSVFNEASEEIISSEFIGNNPVDVNFVSFGNGRDYLIITDLAQELSFIYDKKGKLLTSIPIDSRALQVFPAENDKLKMFSVDERNITISDQR